MQKTNVFRGVTTLAALAFALLGAAQDNRQYMRINVDSSFQPPKAYISYKSKALYDIVLSGGKPVSIVIDGRKVPADSFYIYQDLIDRLNAQVKLDAEQAARDREQAQRDRRQAERDREQADRDREQAERDRRQVERDKERAGRDREQALKDKQQAAEDHIQADKDRERAERDKEQAGRDREQAGRDKEQAERDREQAQRDREQALRDKQRAEEDRKLVRALKAEVVQQGLVADAASVRSIVLNADFLSVNGKQQPEKVHTLFKKRFLKNDDQRIEFSSDGVSITETHR